MARLLLTSVFLICLASFLSACAGSHQHTKLHPHIAGDSYNERHEISLSELIDAGTLEIDLGKRHKKLGWTVIVDIVNDRSGPEQISLYAGGSTSLSLDVGEHCYTRIGFGTDPDNNVVMLLGRDLLLTYNKHDTAKITIKGAFYSDRYWEEVEGEFHPRIFWDKPD